MHFWYCIAQKATQDSVQPLLCTFNISSTDQDSFAFFTTLLAYFTNILFNLLKTRCSESWNNSKASWISHNSWSSSEDKWTRHVQLAVLSSFITGLGDYTLPSAHFGFNFHGLGWAERPICQQHTIACILIDWQMREEFCIYYNEVHSISNIGSITKINSSILPMVLLLKEVYWHPSPFLHTKTSYNKIKHNRKSKHLQVLLCTH